MRKNQSGTAYVYFNLLGDDLIAEIDFRVTSPSYAARMPDMRGPGEPPEGCEYEITDVALVTDRPKHLKNERLEVPQWLRDIIEQSEEVDEAIREAEGKE